MTHSELNQLFEDHQEVQCIADQLQLLKTKIHVEGLVGSSLGFVARSVVEKVEGVHLFLFEEQEDAAYFLNDLENIVQHAPVLFFPSSSRSPYQDTKKDAASVFQRARVLDELSKKAHPLYIVSYPQALAERVPSPELFDQNFLEIKAGTQLSLDELNEKLLEQFQFQRVDYVYEPGQFTIRGGIIDIFSFSHTHPFRLELVGDKVNSIREFEPADQLSVRKVSKMRITANWKGIQAQSNFVNLLSFLPDTSTLWVQSVEKFTSLLDKETSRANLAFQQREDRQRLPAPDILYEKKEEVLTLFEAKSFVEFTAPFYFSADEKFHFQQRPQPVFNKNFDLLVENFRENAKDGIRNILFADNKKQLERLLSILEDLNAKVSVDTIPQSLTEGFIDKTLKIACYTDHQIFERYHRFRLREGFAKAKEALTLKELKQLQQGDYVTHIDHGVGVFSGLEKIAVNGKMQEAIRILYKDSDILYVSIHALHRVSKYSGKEGMQPKVNKLGSNAWQNLKNKTKKKVKELAFDLIKLYAKRKAQKGFAFAPDNYLQNELEASFVFEDTPDQLRATIDVKKDMESASPMDRLICGDVGFGKTEIAIRAAFKAVTDNKQVAVLVPTTILSLQHYKNFKERLKDFPCSVDYMNRFKSKQAQKATLQKVKEGKLDILIGTHRIVSKDVEFKDLGLVIIDEEQKFGVGVKDKLKLIKATVDTLTLTATPIPRTLQFSLMGARDLSIINTPPPNRYPIQTELMVFQEELIKEAILYEISRGGQVFFVHNRVQNIQEVADMLRSILPQVRVVVGHGQMEGKQLEKVMMDFIEGQYDVLVATTIIESGLDIPNANTMIVNNAHQFGLSDLHQLRGRVGRTNKKAFCYLLTPAMSQVSTEAGKRLRAIEQFSDLGSGIHIAMKDMDIRGAGNLLGGEQSGFINDIGFDMYQKILKEAVEELKENEFKTLFEQEKETSYVQDCQIETDQEVLIPDDYVNNIAERLHLYQELDDIENEETLLEFQDRLIDRFGPIPMATQKLFHALRLRWKAKAIGLVKLTYKDKKLLGTFLQDQDSSYFQSAQFTAILNYVQKHPNRCRLSQKRDKLILVISQVENLQKALNVLSSF